ncbi:deaminase domain-containing protein [Delftia tsuruhatensis]|uniref:deaminase domain-containing protein n=2 Tax=Delftia tsuruhatensis TaxID=180282 RepID=UPI001EF4954F|nr:deaminase domain-containing protein [Delftia tsuruhatensis]
MSSASIRTHVRIPARLGHLLAAVVLAVLLVQKAPALAAQPAAPAPVTQADVISAIAAGRDASALLRSVDRSAGGGIATRNTTGKQLALALEALSDAVVTGDAARVRQAHERVLASAMLARDDSVELKDRLAGASLPATFEARRATVQAQIDQLLLKLSAAMQGLDGDARQKAQAMAALGEALATTRQARNDVPVLRAALLPVRPLGLAMRAPASAPAILPSYEAGRESAATPEDVADAPEAALGQEILAKAKELDYDYVRIYEYVRNGIRSEWYPASTKGALGTLRTGAGNAVDQASLLIALLRAAGAPARYVQGVAEIGVDSIASAAGLGDPGLVPGMLAKAGIAYTPVVQGGRVTMVRIEHTWVAVQVPYTNYRGIVLDATGKTWLPLDVFYKTLQPRPAGASLASLGLVLQDLATRYRAGVQATDFGSYLRERVDAALQSRSSSYDAAVEPAPIKPQALGLLPNTLAFAVVAATAESPALPDAVRSTARLRLFNDAAGTGQAGLDISLPVHELFNQRATINYIPAGLEDHRAILLAGGLDLAPLYLFQLRPELRLDGFQRSVGLAPLTGGSRVRFRLDIQTPADTQTVEQSFLVGAYHAIGVGQSGLARSPTPSARDGEYDAARLLDGIVQRYEAQWSAFEAGAAALSGAAIVHPAPSVTIVSNALNAYSVNGVPYTLEWKGVTIDAAARATEVIATDAAGARGLLAATGLAGSSLEHAVFQSQFGVESVSADKLMALARAANITVLTLTSPNAPELATLPVAQATRAELRSWLQAGHSVEIPVQGIAHGAWSGMAWIVSDPSTGASGYYLAGGIAGGATAQNPWTLQFLADALAGAHTDAANNDPSSGTSVELLNAGTDPDGIAGQALPGQALSVRVRDRDGRPVKGASVSFVAVRGGGRVSPATATTNALGVASATVTLGQSTSASPVYVQAKATDKHVTQAGLNIFDASVASAAGTLKPAQPLRALALPDVPATLKAKQIGKGDALPGHSTWESSYSIEVLDKFANPVANVRVTGTGLAATANCDPAVRPTPASVDGPHDTNTYGVATLSITPGPTNATVSPVQVTAGGLSTKVEVRVDASCSAWPRLIVLTWTYLDKDGRPSAATGIGKRFGKPFGVKVLQERASVSTDSSRRCVFGATRTFEPAAMVTASLQVSAGGRAVNLTQVGAGEWESHVVTGPGPAINELVWNLGGSYTLDAMGPGCKALPVDDRLEKASSGGAVFGVRASVGAITSVDTTDGVDPGRLYLSDAGLNAYPIQVPFRLEPEDYVAPAVQVRVFEDGQLVAVRPSDSRQKQGTAQIERGNRFDIVRTYEADAYIDDDIISEKVELPFRQRIVTSYDRVLRLMRDVDIANDRFCAQGSALNFILSQNARITLDATRLSDDDNPVPTGSPVRLVDGQAFAMGANSITLAPDALLPTRNGYAFTLTAVSDKDGSVEPNQGLVISKLMLNDALPVGNILIQGVNVKSGRITLSGMGLGVAARGPQLALRPSYSSGGSGSVGVLGVNWGHNFDASLSTTACGDILVNAGDGGFVRFLPQGDGTLVPARGYHGTLIANKGDRSYDFYSKDGTRYHFGFIGGKRQWALQSITDTNSNALTMTYDIGVDAPLLLVSNAHGQSLQFAYQTRAFVGSGAAVNVLQGVQGPEGMGLAFEYDAAGNLVKITRTDAPEATESYSYSDHTGPLGMSNLLLSHTNALGQTTQFKYHSGPVLRQFGNGRIPSFESTVIGVTAADGAITGFAYNARPEAPATEVTDARGKVTRYAFNKYGNPLTIAGPSGTTSMTWATDDVLMLDKTDANGVVTRYTYDANGNQTSEQVGAAGGAASATTSQTWLAQTVPPFIKNRRLSFTDRRGLTTTASYDARGNLTGEQMPDGSRISHSVAANGDRQSSTDARGNTTHMRYDARGMRSAVIDALGGTTTLRHDNRGRQVAVVDAEGRTSEMQYNTLDQLTQITLAAGTTDAGQRTQTWDALGNRLSETDEEGRTTSYQYDAMNRVVRKSLPAGAIATTYDLLGNKTSETNLRGDKTTYAYDDANRLVLRTEPATPPKTTGYAYDGVGNITTQTDALGRQTTHTYNALNQRTASRLPDGSTSTTTYDGNGNKTSETDALGRVTTYVHDALNRLLSQTIAGQSKRSMAYDAGGNLVGRTDANGNTTTFAYDALNRIVAETDALGRVTQTDYDKVGNKLQVTNPLRQAQKWQYNARNWVVAQQDGEGHQIRYSHDKVGNRRTETWPNGNIIRFEYDALNRLTRSEDTLGLLSATTYDADGHITSQSDARGNATTFTWDAVGRQLSRSQPTAAGNAVTTTGHDAAGNIVSVTTPGGNVITTKYDSRDRPIEVSDSLGRVSATTYDAVGNPLTQTDGRGRVLTHQYNDFNLRTASSDGLGQVSTVEYDLHGNKTRETDANGHATSYQYDVLNRVVGTTRAGIQLQKTEYDEAGRIQFETDARGNKVGYEYDKRGLLVKTNRSLGAIDLLQRDAMGDVTLATDPEGRTTTTGYDARRRAISVADGLGHTTSSSYDLAGNLTETKAPNGATVRYGYEQANRLASITQVLDSGQAQASRTYDTSGNLIEQSDLNGHRTAYAYDARNRLVRKTLPGTPAGEAQETNGYDNADGLTEHTDANGNRFVHTLDARGRRIQTVTTASQDNGPGSVLQTTFGYDAGGNLTSTAQTDDSQATRTETTTYDAFNRPVRVTDAWGNSLTHGYDAQGNRVSTTAAVASVPGGSATTIEYDALNRRTSQGGAGGTTRISYDKSGRVIQLLHPDGSSTRTRYDKAGRVAAETSSTQPTAGAGNTLLDTVYTYDVNGNRIGSSRTESLSAAHRSASLSATLPGGKNSASHSRTRVESWTYDAQDRLTGHTTPERRTTWQLDAGGRRIQQNVVATVGATGPPAGANALETSAAEPVGTLTYTYDSRDQLTRISGATSTSYTYDANGNRLTQTHSRGAGTTTTRYHWNAQDQLVSVAQDSGSGPEILARYRYNAANLRAEKLLGNAGLSAATQGSAGAYSPLAYERIQWDGLHARRSFEITGTDKRQTLRSDTDAAVQSGNTAPWLFNRTQYANGLGSASSTTQLHADSNGNLVATVTSEGGAAKADSLLLYSAYGAIDSEASGNAGTAIQSNGNGFGSYYADPETGLLYARARYYDPASGQFISRDPVEGDARLPITWGAYQYGRYNPYRYVDPNGKFSTPGSMCSTPEECAGIGDVAIGIGRSLWKGVKDAAGLAWALAQSSADAELAVYGDSDAQKRLDRSAEVLNQVVRNIPNLPSQALQQQKVVSAQIEQLRKNGEDHAANQLTAENAADIAQWGVAGYGVGKSAIGLVNRRRIAAAVGNTVSRVVEAKTPSAVFVPVVPQVSDVTPILVAEGSGLRAAGKGQSATGTAKAAAREGPCCFAPGTLVSTEEGDRPIESIQVGDRVWTRMEDGSGEAFLAPVTATHIRDDRPILRLTVELALPGEEAAQPRTEDLLVTPGHPFHVPGRGFVSVEELQVGDELVSLDTQTRLRMRALRLESPQGTTYNLTVETGHTFFVGGLGTWVHNVGPCNTCADGVCVSSAAEFSDKVADTSALAKKVMDIRSGLPSGLRRSGNVAVAEIDIPGVSGEMAAHSQVSVTGKGLVGSGSGNFMAQLVPNKAGNMVYRGIDTEYKIMDNIADQLGSNFSAKGVVNIFTEKPACASCLGVAEQFKEKYPNVMVNIYDNGGVMLRPPSGSK